MDVLLWGTVLLVALFGLVKSADYFTLGAEKIGLFYGLSSFIVGATIISIGSSMPEIATSIMGVLNGQTNFAIDNIIGSNIANTLLIGGIVSIMVGTLKIKKELMDVDLPFFFISSAIFVLFLVDGIFTWKEGALSIILLVIFMFYTLSDKSVDEENEEVPKKFSIQWIIYIVLGVIGIYFGAKYTIESVTNLGDILNIPSSIITMLAVAIGTSLPELIISVRAAKAGKHSIALGNIFGSNTFNVLAVAGIPSFIKDLTVSEGAQTMGIPLLVVATLAFILGTTDNKIQKWEGMAFLVMYALFVGKIIGWM